MNTPLRSSPTSRRAPEKNRHRSKSRKGNVLVLSAALMIAMMAFLAFGVDVGYMMTTQAECQRSVDAAALAGAGALVQGQQSAESRAIEYLVRNPVGTQTVVDQDLLASQIADFLANHSDDYEIKVGHWNPETKQLEESTELPSTIKVALKMDDQPLFFARVLGKETFGVQAESIAMYQPRDICLVVDLSASMNDDSEFKAFSTLGQADVEANLLEMYEDLGEPNYGGVMQFEPDWITVKGDLWDNGQRQHAVEYRWNEIKVTSTKELLYVVAEYDYGGQVGGWQSGSEIVLTGNGNRIDRVWVYSDDYWSTGNYDYFDFRTSTINDTIEEALNLDGVSYPYPSGSWYDYFNYCRSTSNQNGEAGYFYKFGYMNLINYWLDKKPMHSQTPDLWMASAQPITAVKDSVDVFMDYIQEVDTDDRVGLSIYNYYSGGGSLAYPLTSDFNAIKTQTRSYQAGHHHHYTNIGIGMNKAREELEDNGRLGAFKMMVLMTDGKANWYSGGYSLDEGRDYVLDEAALAAEKKIPIVTISLGANADEDLMQEVADITNGKHFNIPGGQSVAEYEEALKQVFRNIADDRPLKIVQ